MSRRTFLYVGLIGPGWLYVLGMPPRGHLRLWPPEHVPRTSARAHTCALVFGRASCVPRSREHGGKPVAGRETTNVQKARIYTYSSNINPARVTQSTRNWMREGVTRPRSHSYIYLYVNNISVVITMMLLVRLRLPFDNLHAAWASTLITNTHSPEGENHGKQKNKTFSTQDTCCNKKTSNKRGRLRSTGT